MANPIAELIATLGFRYDKKPLEQFQKDLRQTAGNINSASGKSVGGATKKAGKKQDEFVERLRKNYNTKVKPSLKQMREDLKGIDEAFKQNRISSEEYARYRERIVEQLGRVEKQKEVAHQKAIQETQKVQERRIKDEDRKFRQFYKAQQQEERRLARERDASNKKRLANLFRIEKTYDKHRAQLKQVRSDYSFVNQEFKKGNITIEQRERQLQSLIAQYRRLQAAQAATAGGRVGSAGGAFAGGQDPRQVGNHRIISAIHSDTGLGAIAGGFAAAQSTRVYQDYVALRQSLSAALGDRESGLEEMEWLVGITEKLGTNLTASAEGYKTFAAATRGTELAGADTRKTFEAVSSYAKTLNLSADDTKGVFRA